MKTLTFILIFIISVYSAVAQDIKKVADAKDLAHKDAPADTASKKWRVFGSGSIAFSQAAFSNWASGGQNSLGLVAWLNLNANYRNNRHVWANTIDLGYGFNMLGKGNNLDFNKTNDKIELTTAYGYELGTKKHWYFTVLTNFRTQFDAGYNYPDDSTVISKFMAPGYLVAGLGITYAPVKWFALYMSPTSGRFTFVTDQRLADSGAFGVKRGKNLRGEFGPYIRTNINADIAKNVNLSTTLELFTDYLHEFGNIDVNWNLLLSLKVNKWLAASIQTQLIYDNDIMIQTEPSEPAGPRTQFKELFGIGLTYKLNQ